MLTRQDAEKSCKYNKPLPPGRGSGLCVALVGPDGVGKSTAIELMRRWFERELPAVQIILRQWRPALVPALIRFTGRPEPSAKSVKPRRHPGKFHYLRIAYYFLDYLVGGWWKDKRHSSASRIIIYDRCALDMTVDPVRFGLRSARGTKWLWKLTPKPDLVILLYDTPERIWERKRELEMHEMGAQLKTWLELAEEGKVQAVIKVDAGPEQISARVRDLVVDAFIAKNQANRGGAEAAEEALQWIGRILAGGDGHGRELIQFGILPTASNPRLLIPLQSRKTAGNSLEIYNAQKSAARFSRRLLAAGLRTGIAQSMVRARTWQSSFLQDHLKRVFGEKEIAISVSLGTPGATRKPTVQVMDEHGKILGYTKIGWSPETISLVQNEESVLGSLKDVAFSTARVPRILHAGRRNELYLLVLEPAPSPAGESPHEPGPDHFRFVKELQRAFASSSSLPWSQGGEILNERIESLRQMGHDYYVHLLEWAFEFCSERVGRVEIPSGLGHGDFAPWNIRVSRDKLFVLDWEYARPGQPAGWDLFHFIIGTAVEVQGQPAGKIYQEIMEPGTLHRALKSHLQEIGLPDEFFAPLFVAYLAEALSGSLSFPGEAVSEQDRMLQRTWSSLLTFASHREDFATCSRV